MSNDIRTFEKSSTVNSDDKLRISLTPYIDGRDGVAAVELGGRMVLLTTDDMMDLHRELAIALGFIDAE